MFWNIVICTALVLAFLRFYPMLKRAIGSFLVWLKYFLIRKLEE